MNATENENDIITTSDTGVEPAFLLECLHREMLRRADLFKEKTYNPELFYSSIRRPNCGIKKHGDQNFVSTVDQLVELITQIEEVKVERAYSGQDHDKVILLRARIPDGYFGRVAYIKYRHIPKHFKNRKLVDTISMPYRGPKVDGPEPEGEVVRVLRELQPVFTDRSCYEIPKEVIEPEYHWITFKILREQRTLKNWFAGVDKDCLPCSSKEDELILIGRHYKDKYDKK